MTRARRAWAIAALAGLGACASGAPPVVHVPQPEPGVLSLFHNGQPIAAVETGEARLLLALDPTRLAGRQYGRLWLLYQNTGRDTLLLEPAQVASLELLDVAAHGTQMLQPERPSEILAHLSNEKAAAMIARGIGGALEAAAAESRLEARLASGRAGDDAAGLATWYDLYRSSISAGILRRNTLFPGQGVQGYVYFELPARHQELNWGQAPVSYVGSRDFEHRVHLHLASGERAVHFRPADGE